MHTHSMDKWKISHDFSVDHRFGEKRSRMVLVITAITMVVEIVAGTVYGSMALLADGWHMMTHVAAFGITLFAYAYARKHRENADFSFSTGKVGVLGGFASAVALAVVALMMGMESVERLFSPHAIRFNEAIAVAVLGLIVNGVSVFLLRDSHHHHDHNLVAAYFHVLADTLTSVLAIIALVLGKWLGWIWLDPAMGIVGALVIGAWAFGLMKSSSRILLDRSANAELREKVRIAIESDRDNRIADLHLWNVSPEHTAVVLSVVTHEPQPPEYYRELLSRVAHFEHVTIEVNRCGETL